MDNSDRGKNRKGTARPFSGSVNRKKVVDSSDREVDDARERAGSRSVERNRNRNLFGELHPEAFPVFPSLSLRLIYVARLFSRFHRFYSFPLLSHLSLLLVFASSSLANRWPNLIESGSSSGSWRKHFTILDLKFTVSNLCARYFVHFSAVS